MVGACLGQLDGTDSGGVNGFRDKCIDVFKFSRGDIYINTAQDIDCLSNGFPVEGGIVVNFYIQVLFQGGNRLFLAAFKVCLVNLVVGSF